VPVSAIDAGIGTKARGSQGTLERSSSTLQFRIKKLGIERPALGD
jgi:hypothetical protein